MRWGSKNTFNADEVAALAKALNINVVLAQLLMQRGVRTYDEAKDFFRPTLDSLHDPFLMKDMDVAINRIEKAITSKEKVLIYGDYDVDGTTAVALVYTFFKNYFAETGFYIPDRYTEGYGVSKNGIDWAKENGFTLIIALDCGIKAIDKVDYANQQGIDFIICDHHRPGNVLPAAVAVLDQKREDCNYPYKELSGCGIGFKLVQAFARHRGISFFEIEHLLDLVAISIAADIVPVTGENRTLTYFGLRQLNANKRPGIKAILEAANYTKEVTVNDIVFTIAPRINAAGRMQHGKHAVELLTSTNAATAKTGSDLLQDKNKRRKEEDEQTTIEAVDLIKQDPNHTTYKSTVVYQPHWHKGVIGIVASRLIDKFFYRPTIVLTNGNGTVSGSARSVKDFDVYNAIESCSHLLDQFGGHMYAAGLTMKPENVEPFIAEFEKVVASTIEPHMLQKEIEIDAELNLTEITPNFFNVLKQFAPFGPGNMSPIFKTSLVKDNGKGRVVGNNHLKLSLTQNGSKPPFDAIAFGFGEHINPINKGTTFSVCYHIEENYFNGNTNLQLNVKDLKIEQN
ncbi:MAG TPA: single-stranded-DNA-specific exonuclease RecJ [Bacteroidia bacterium]|nr:single-stranded-DNA-specific exonuclease RecJ [Bacteroidia bacterium]HNU33719.1 single-stranded-DNA-specific exonuclease RecJ [Bacteroidia bacterium]